MCGGMRQRVMIAMALACRPKVMLADEPTTALDVTIQAQILKLMNQLKDEVGTSIVLITHDLGVIAKMVQRVLVMYAGVVVEEADVRSLFAAPLHPYTVGLLTRSRGSGWARAERGSRPSRAPFRTSLSCRADAASRIAAPLSTSMSQAGAAPRTAGSEPGGGRKVRCWLHVKPK